MTTRYFKATDGEKTYFRASSGAYESLTGLEPGALRFGWSFHRDGRGRHPVTEITRKEYVALIALKQKRVPGRNAPGYSWVLNSAIAAEVAA